MDARKIHANILMHLPAVTLLEVNKYLQLALDEINSNGKERITKLTVSVPGISTPSTPSERTPDRAYNYYADLKCLVIPSTILYVAKLSIDGQAYTPISASDYLSLVGGGYYYHLTEVGEMYFANDLVVGSVVTILGRTSGTTLAMLGDNYLPYLTYYVLCGLYALEYKDADSYAIYRRKLDESKPNTMQEVQRISFNKRTGRLY
jgi:hypothetical protein